MINEASTNSVCARVRSGEVTRQRILDVAREMFSRQGFARTTIRDIADRVQVSDPALYHYFPSKQHIVDALLAEPTAIAVQELFRPTRPVVAERMFSEFITFARSVDIVQVTARQLAEGDDTAIVFRRRLQERRDAALAPAMRVLYGADADVVLETLNRVLAGVLWDALLRAGASLAEVVDDEQFQDRVRALIGIVLGAPASGDLSCPA